MTINPADLERVVGETLEDLELSGVVYNFKIEPSCRVCSDPSSMRVVNQYLTQGLSYAAILRTGEINRANEERPNEQITYNSIRNHAVKHFPRDKAAQAVYRAIVEKRAMEANVDFVGGVASALTPIAYWEVMMQKGYNQMVEDRTRVSVEQGHMAAAKIQQIYNADDANADVNEMRAQLSRIIAAVKSEVSAENWDRIVGRLNGAQSAEAQAIQEAEVVEEASAPRSPTKETE